MPKTPLTLAAILIAALLPAAAEARQASPQQCARWEQQLQQVQSRLRAGYRNQEGNRLREQRRQLRQKLAGECPRHRPR